MDALARLRAAVHRDPRGVAEEAVGIVGAARAAGDYAPLSRALSVLGRARLSLGEIDLAESDLRGAIEAGDCAADDELLADAHLGMAAVMSLAGRTAEAFGHLDETARQGSEQLQAYALLQRAVIQRRLGQLPQAIRSFDSALPVLRRLDARIDIAKVLVNRGVTRIHLGDCAGAIADLTESGRLFAADGDPFGIARSRHGLGWAYARLGELPRALEHLDAASDIFARHGHDGLEVEVDRIEVLLSAGLHVAAGDLAETTAGRLQAAGDHSTAAEVWLLRGAAALLDDDPKTAAAYAERARAMYAEQGATGWELLARLHVLRCTDDQPGELQSLAAALEATGNARGATTALSLAAVAACSAGAVDTGSRLALRCTTQATRLGLFEVRMQAAHAGAMCAAARGDLPSARRQVRHALRDLAAHRTTLAATDARASVAVHVDALTGLGLHLALRSESAPTLLRWIELARAGRGNDVRPHPPVDSGFAAELTELRSLTAGVRRSDATAGDTGALLARQRQLERSIHRRHLRTPPTVAEAGRTAVGVGGIREALAGGVLIELAAIGSRMVGVVVDAGPARIVDVGAVETVVGVAQTLRSALHAAVTPTSRYRRPPELLGRCLTVLDAAIADAACGEGPVTLVVPPALHTVPWNLLPSLSGRGVSVAPSAAWWLSVQAERTPMTGPVALVAGPRLREAEREVHGIADVYPGATVLSGPAATADAVLAALAAAPVAHLACHGSVRYDNPLWSALELHDGPLYVYDLEPIARTPEFVVLSGCDTGVGIRAGDQLLGLSTTLLQHGTRHVVASLCPLPDSPATRETMTALHARVSAGAAVSTALASLSAEAMGDDGAMIAACLGCFGAG